MRRFELESKYLKNGTIENKGKYKKQNNLCSKRYKTKQKKFYSNLELHKRTDNKWFQRTIEPLLSDGCKNGISEQFILAQTFNKYFGSALGKLASKRI